MGRRGTTIPTAVATAAAILTGLPVAAQTYHSACLKASESDWYISALGDQQSLQAHVSWCRGWETFELEDVNGGELMDGDEVYVKTAHGKYWTASRPTSRTGPFGTEKAGAMSAAVTHKRSWELFTIDHIVGDQGNRVCGGDEIALRTAHDTYVYMESGGGDEVGHFRSYSGQSGPYAHLVFEPENDPCLPWYERPLAIATTMGSNVACILPGGEDDEVGLSGDCAPHNPADQRWLYNPPRRTIHLAADFSQCLQIEFNSVLEFDDIVVRPCHYGTNQQWDLDTRHQAVGEWRNLADPGRCVAGITATVAGTSQVTWDYSTRDCGSVQPGDTTMQWAVEYDE